MSSVLFDAQGKRLYLTVEERTRFLAAAAKTPREVRTFCMTLAYTGCRPSEALALLPSSIDLTDQAITFETLKKRRSGIFRAVPVPESLIDALDLVHGLREARKGDEGPLWTWARSTAYERVKEVMRVAGIEGPQSTAKGLRHAFAIAALQDGVPLNKVSQYLGHANLETTAIYANALGQEERQMMAKFWARF